MIQLCPFDFKGTFFLKSRKSISISVESVRKRGQFCHASPSGQIYKRTLKTQIAVRVSVTLPALKTCLGMYISLLSLKLVSTKLDENNCTNPVLYSPGTVRSTRKGKWSRRSVFWLIPEQPGVTNSPLSKQVDQGISSSPGNLQFFTELSAGFPVGV